MTLAKLHHFKVKVYDKKNQRLEFPLKLWTLFLKRVKVLRTNLYLKTLIKKVMHFTVIIKLNNKIFFSNFYEQKLFKITIRFSPPHEYILIELVQRSF